MTNRLEVELLIYDMFPESENEDFPIEWLAEKIADGDLELDDFILRLLDMIDVGESPLTTKKYKGFAKDGVFLLKKEV